MTIQEEEGGNRARTNLVICIEVACVLAELSVVDTEMDGMRTTSGKEGLSRGLGFVHK